MERGDRAGISDSGPILVLPVAPGRAEYGLVLMLLLGIHRGANRLSARSTRNLLNHNAIGF